MAFELLMNVSHGDIAAATGIVTHTASHSVFSAILSRLVVLGQIGYLFELLFGTATVVMGTFGLLRCLRPAASPIHEHGDPSNDPTRDEGSSDHQPEITIRLESGFLRILDRHRCIVMIHRPSGDSQDTGREAWYARGAK